MKSRIFISSVQREFAKERKALAEYVRKDAILGRFFDVFKKCNEWGIPAPEWTEDDADDFRHVGPTKDGHWEVLP